MLAKKRLCLTTLHEDIREGRMDKRYLFVAHGDFDGGLGHVSLKYPLYKYLLPNGERRVKVEDFGQASLTTIKWLGSSYQGRCFVGEAQLKTGRTHQIRVHLASQGHPIAGDDKYGDFEWNKVLNKQGLKRMFLHAWRLQFTHPTTGKRVELKSALPPELQLYTNHVKSKPSPPSI